ncbi:MAG: DNA-binding winged helix-turn-helix (wHTH) protein [Flavobacteriales bacterium]|jgi:DNA-binding winged helix-turn-helix (wHTH) protein
MIYRFGDFEISTDEFCLRKNQIIVAIEPKVFDVIVYLVGHRERVVTRQEIFDRIWFGLGVSTLL